MKLFDLSGRVAAITGTSRGIGRELALGFAEAGATVVGCARRLEAAPARLPSGRGSAWCRRSLIADHAIGGLILASPNRAEPPSGPSIFRGCSGFYPWLECAAACRELWVSR